MARRDLRRHKVRTILTCLLVALPVFVAVIAAHVVYNDRWTGEREASMYMYDADARVLVTRFDEVRVRPALWGNAAPTADAQRRDPASVAVADLIPPGGRVIPDLTYGQARLVTGGSAEVIAGDFADPIFAPFADLIAGRWPAAADEIVVPEAVADELGFLDAGELNDDAALTLRDGQTVRVVGLADRPDRSEPDFWMLASTSSALATDRPARLLSYLVDLPAVDQETMRSFVSTAAAAGAAVQPRTAVTDPDAWGLGDMYGTSGPVAVEPILIGGLVLLVGLLEVVLLVGAAFSVSARRQVRDLGLLASNGAAAPDVRRVLLAQGLVLGIVSSVVGAVTGTVAFARLAPSVSERLESDLFAYDIFWPAVVVIAILGSFTAVVAALLPALRVGRLTPLQSLSGRFPLRPGESRAHRPAFVLAVGGLAFVGLGGIGAAYAEGRYVNWSGPAIVVAGLGFVMLVAGAIWSAPYVVRRVAAMGDLLPLSGRYAFRDAGRHRFRSAAAVMALMITVAGTVLAGFGLSSASASATQGSLAPNTAIVGTSGPGRAEDSAAIRETLEGVLAPMAIAEQSALKAPKRGDVMVQRDFNSVQVVDEASLRELVTLDQSALEVFTSGGVVTTEPRYADEVRLGLYGRSRKAQETWTLPSAVVTGTPGLAPYSTNQSFVSDETAEELGLTRGYTEYVVRTSEPVTRDQLDRLAVYGLYGWSDDPDRAAMGLLRFAGLGAAGVLSMIVVGIAVALAAAESRDEVATLAAVGAGPLRRRGFGAMHGLFLGLVGTVLGYAVAIPAGLSFTQADGLPGLQMPWLILGGLLIVVLPLSYLAGAVVTPSRLTMTRRPT